MDADVKHMLNLTLSSQAFTNQVQKENIFSLLSIGLMQACGWNAATNKHMIFRKYHNVSVLISVYRAKRAVNK